MSTTPTPNAAEIKTTRTRLTTQEAPHTFDPLNTNPAPQMFADKWEATDE